MSIKNHHDESPLAAIFMIIIGLLITAAVYKLEDMRHYNITRQAIEDARHAQTTGQTNR